MSIILLNAHFNGIGFDFRIRLFLVFSDQIMLNGYISETPILSWKLSVIVIRLFLVRGKWNIFRAPLKMIYIGCRHVHLKFTWLHQAVCPWQCTLIAGPIYHSSLVVFETDVENCWTVFQQLISTWSVEMQWKMMNHTLMNALR